MRCDFSSVMQIIVKHTNLAQDKIVAGIFTDRIAHDLINSTIVSRWVSGEKPFSSTIAKHYLAEYKEADLSCEIEENIIPHIVDINIIQDKIYRLVENDVDISFAQKDKLLDDYPCQSDFDFANFIGSVLYYCIGRKHYTPTQLVKQEQHLPDTAELILDGEPPKACKFFCGRDSELEQLHMRLNEHKKVFVRGIPGMGKSELVKAYAKEYRKSYSRILYYTYDDSLKKLVANIAMPSDRFTNSEDILFHAHNRYLRSLGESVLLIIDNFNATQTQDELLHVMMKYRCKIIFTTRSNFDGDDDFVVEEIADINTLISLFGKFYNAAESHHDTVKAIIETVHKHTLAVELAARLLQKGILKPPELLQRLSESHPDINSTDKIKFTKDGTTTKETYYRHIQTLFSLHLLENNSTNIMRCMAFIPNSGIESWLFAKWLELPDLNDINDLIEHGFIQENNQTISLHPMIREIVLADLKPSVGNCIRFVEMLKFICLHHGINIPCHKLLFAVIENIIKVAVKDDLPAYLSFIEDVFPYMQIKEYEHGMKLIIAEMSSVLTGYNIGENRNYALLYHYQAAYKMLSKDYKAALALAEKAIKYCDENSHLRFNLGITLGNLYRELKQYDKSKIELERCYKVADYEVEKSNETHDFVDAMKSYVALLAEVGEIEKAKFIARKWDSLIAEKPVVLAYD